ncbi:hypothetical protein V8C26DRAFT_399991 [Trichoderma gracile]
MRDGRARDTSDSVLVVFVFFTLIPRFAVETPSPFVCNVCLWVCLLFLLFQAFQTAA